MLWLHRREQAVDSQAGGLPGEFLGWSTQSQLSGVVPVRNRHLLLG